MYMYGEYLLLALAGGVAYQIIAKREKNQMPDGSVSRTTTFFSCLLVLIIVGCMIAINFPGRIQETHIFVANSRTVNRRQCLKSYSENMNVHETISQLQKFQMPPRSQIAFSLRLVHVMFMLCTYCSPLVDL